MKKKSIKKWEFSRKKGEEISIPKFGGGGKNKQFWTEYSPLCESPMYNSIKE